MVIEMRRAWNAVVFALTLAACGSSGSTGIMPSATPSSSANTPYVGVTPTPATASPSTEASPASSSRQALPSPPVSDSPVPAANGRVTFTNRTGAFTITLPAAWRASSCEDNGVGYLVAVTDSPAPCGRGEYYNAWIFAMSIAGDQRKAVPPVGGNYAFLAPVSGSQDVISADGVHGIRYTATVAKDGLIGTPKGTTQIYYLFFNGARTYFFLYDRLPGQPDQTADFDRAVEHMLSFSA